MDFIDQIRQLATRIANIRDMIQTEEATKNAMIMPFIQILGYNVFDPLEVTPEYISDIGTKKGEKVDYAILRESKPIILFETKKAGAELHVNHASQLFRYFHVTEARFGVLTNGIIYKFFTDLEVPNKMDEKPFFEFNILDFKERDIEELKKFCKSAYDLDSILNTANDLKYTRLIQSKLAELMVTPTDDFVRLLATDLLGNRRFTPAIKDQFATITKRAFEQMIGERINERLKGAMTPDLPVKQPMDAPVPDVTNLSATATPEVNTTAEEIEAFHAIKAILRDIVAPKRIFMRDAQSYCAILLDDNNRKTICRLRFNNTTKLSIGIMNERKEEEKINLDSVDDLFTLADRLRAALNILTVNELS